MVFVKKHVIDFRHQPTVQQTCIGLADDFYKTIVREDGSLNYNYAGRNDFSEERQNYAESISPFHTAVNENHGFLHRLKPRPNHRDKLISREQDFMDPRVAIVRTREEYQHSCFTWDLFACRDEASGLRADIILWELHAKKGFGYASSRIEIELHGDRSSAPCVLESAGTTDFYTCEGLRLPGLNQFQFLHEGETWKGVFAVVLEGKIEPVMLTHNWGCYAREECKQYWLRLRPFKRRFNIPDIQIQEMIESCARNILQAREIHDNNTVFQVGPTIYRGLWTIDGHFLLQAAHIMGRQKEAFEQGLTAILRRIQPNGSVEIIPQHLKETGIAMATIVRQCELMGDNERLIELWPTILRALDYLRLLREQAQSLGSSYPGIFPPAIIDGGIEGPHPDYTTPSWALIGLKYARNAGKRLNLPRTEDIAAFHDEIYQAFLSCAERDIAKTAAGIPYIPMIMEHRDYNHPQSATWAFAHAIYPGEIFTPDHDYVKNLLALLDSVDDEQGIPKETGWIHDQGIWGYSSMFYAQVWLYAGRGDKAIDYLYAFANHAAPSRVWREEQSLTASHSAEYCGDMPHNWGSAEFIRLVRNAIIMERQGNIELLVGLPAEWLPEEGKELCIEDSPTRYGLVTLQLRVVDGGYELEYRRRPGVIEPSAVILHWKNKTRSLPADSGVAAVLRESLA